MPLLTSAKVSVGTIWGLASRVDAAWCRSGRLLFGPRTEPELEVAAAVVAFSHAWADGGSLPAAVR